MRFIIILAALLLGGCWQNSDRSVKAVTAGDYPEKPIEIIIPFGTGGASDIFVRRFSRSLSADFPYGIHFSNILDDGGRMATVKAYQAPADGYTLLEIAPSTLVSEALSTSKTPSVIRDFDPIAKVQSDHYVVSVATDSDIDSFQQLVKRYKGKTVYVSGISQSLLDTILIAMLSDQTGVRFRIIPYRSGTEAKTAIFSGETTVYIDKLISAMPMITKGLIKPLLVISDKKLSDSKYTENIQTSEEAGLNIPLMPWRAFLVRKNTSRDIRRYLAQSMKHAVSIDSSENSAHSVPSSYMGPEETEAFIIEQYGLIEKIIKKYGIKR